MILVGRKIVTRSEFWALPPGEVHWLLNAHFPPEAMAENDDDKFGPLYQMLMDAKGE
jgi:hypothetical protein